MAEYFLCHTSTHEPDNARHDLVAKHEHAILLRERHSKPARLSSGYDCDLIDGVGMWSRMHHDCMTCFMISDRATLVFTDDAALELDTADQRFFNSFLKVEHRDRIMTTAYCHDRRFIDNICQVGS